MYETPLTGESSVNRSGSRRKIFSESERILAAEAAQPAHDSGTVRAACERLDVLDELVACIDVDARVLVGEGWPIVATIVGQGVGSGVGGRVGLQAGLIRAR